MQRGYAPVRGDDKSGLLTMDESSILRRRGLQVGEHMYRVELCRSCRLTLYRAVCMRGLFISCVALLTEHS